MKIIDFKRTGKTETHEFATVTTKNFFGWIRSRDVYRERFSIYWKFMDGSGFANGLSFAEGAFDAREVHEREIQKKDAA